MITISETGKSRGWGSNKKTIVELRGTSTDEKPLTINGITIDNGSIFIEIDTGKIYMYDLENTTWSEI
jgi:hypothetical protein